MQPYKILAINSSPNFSGKTASFLKTAITGFRKLNCLVEKVDLYKENLSFETGKLDRKNFKLTALQKKISECDGFIIATPVYWFNTPAILKAFIDNLTILEEESPNFLLEGKVAGIIVYSPQGGEVNVLQILSLTFNHLGVTFPPYSLLYYRNKEDSWFKKDLLNLPRRVVQQIKLQKDSNIKWDW